jgi:hypothetical protein
MPNVNFHRAERYIDRTTDKIIGESASEFHSYISLAWPVDTGWSLSAWKAPVRVKPGSWVVVNSVDYSAVLWQGRHTVSGKVYGSTQMPHGGEPIARRVQLTMKQRLRNALKS